MAKTRKHIRQGNHYYNIDDNYIPVITPDVTTDLALANVVACAESTDAYQGPDLTLTNGLWVRFGSTCTGYGYFANNSGLTTSSTDRYELAPGDQIIVQVANANELYFVGSATDATFYVMRG